MPLLALHLLSLRVPIQEFLTALSSSGITPLTTARVVRWIILPTHISTATLLAQNHKWHLLVVLPNDRALPAALLPLTLATWTVRAGVPSRLLQDFNTKNNKLLRPPPDSLPALTGALQSPRLTSSAQELGLSHELRAWIGGPGATECPGAISMLNLLAFKAGMKDSYLQYGKAFAESIGSRRGGEAKIVGTVVSSGSEIQRTGPGEGEAGRGWDEVAIAHYPSLLHFADMLASEDYQAVNHRFRVPALEDTFILCTTELDVEGEGMGKGAKRGAKL